MGAMTGVSATGRRRVVARRVLWALAAAHLAEAVLLRRRAVHIPRLAAAPADVEAASAGAVGIGLAPLDLATRAAAAAELDATGLDALDLVPGDLPADRALRLLRRVDPQRLHVDVFHAPGGAHEALALRPVLADRLAHRPPVLDRGDLVRRTVDAQRYAPRTAAVRVVPQLTTGPWRGDDRWRELEELTAGLRPHVAPAVGAVGLELVHLAALTVGVTLAPAAGAAALVTWAAQPLVALAGGTGGDRDGRDGGSASGWRRSPASLAATGLARLPRAWSATLGAAVAGSRRAAAARRSAAPASAVPGAPAGRDVSLFEPRRDACPWCGAAGPAPLLDVPDLLAKRPGTFHLDRCGACGHVFQNPALSAAGLDHHYDQFYDGVGEEQAEAMFTADQAVYERRAASIARVAKPHRWLDVGTGHGHFCLWVQQRWPAARVEALDQGEAVDEVVRRGWAAAGHRGQFPALAADLAGRYDVVSMLHYLEHTQDPRAELASAARVLVPGGHLLVEVPDPDARWSLLGRFWVAWLQPQHLHLVPRANLVAELEAQGFEVLSVESGARETGPDLSMAAVLVLQRWTRSPHLPWLPPPTAVERAARVAGLVVVAPVMVLALALDRVKDVGVRPDVPGSAYRVVARRR